MTKQEFDSLTMRNGSTINTRLYELIEQYYMSDNDYHYYNNPQHAEEDKQAFCKRVFVGKVNTAKTILAKIIAEQIRENNWCLRGNKTADKAMLDHHALLITEHTTIISKWGF